MKRPSPRLIGLVWPALVSLPALAFESPAPNNGTLEPVIVTASRLPQLLQTAAIGASIITAEQIERAGVVDANEAIRKLGGVVGRTDLSNGREYTLDLRGYGDTANQNVVVLVDGIRLSENELMSARLTAIPVEQIDRIEIVRGGASVSWGEGASAGVINVILKSGLQQRSSGRLSAAVESFGGRDVRASALWAVAPDLNLEGSLRHIETDGYRDNSDYRQKSGSLGLSWARQGWTAKARVQHEDNESGLAGALTFAQYQQNRRQASRPTDDYSARSTLYTGNLQHQAGAWTAAIDLGYKALSSYARSFSVLDVDRTQRQVSPRVTYAEQWQGVAVSTTLGLDWQQWRYDEAVSGQDGRQLNRAAYLRSEFSLPSKTRLTGGLRTERVTKKSSAGTYSSAYDNTDSVKASEFALSQTVAPGVDVYGRLASSYRLPNLDESGYSYQNEALRPQKNKDRELGLKVAQRGYSAVARWFRQTTVDEIAVSPDFEFKNANIDPTRRQGVELEGRWMPSRDWTLSATWQRMSAKYRSGINAGKEQVLVAPRTATLRAAYRFDDRQTLDVGVQHLAAMRFGDDADNQCARRIPRSTLLDARYAWTDQTWTIAVSGTNLTDHKGYNYAYSCTAGSLYPEPGRLLRLTASRQF